MSLQSFDFRQLVVLFLSLGPHKQRELALFASVSADVVAQWGKGTARPHRHTEEHIKHYLRSKLADVEQLKKDREAQPNDLKRALEFYARAEAAWDNYLSSLEDKEAHAHMLREKTSALSSLRRRLYLP